MPKFALIPFNTVFVAIFIECNGPVTAVADALVWHTTAQPCASCVIKVRTANVLCTRLCKRCVMAPRPVIRDQVAEALDDIADKNGYSSYDEAISHALREAGYDV